MDSTTLHLLSVLNYLVASGKTSLPQIKEIKCKYLNNWSWQGSYQELIRIFYAEMIFLGENAASAKSKFSLGKFQFCKNISIFTGKSEMKYFAEIQTRIFLIKLTQKCSSASH